MENLKGTYEEYLEAYAKEHKITKEEAETHELVQIVKDHYEQGADE
jgi:hypothetical protein